MPAALDERDAPRPGRVGMGLLIVLTLAVVLRTLNYAALVDGPALLPHGVSDMLFFETWADRIAAGDVWTDDAFHPVHHWHRDVARLHFAAHPDDPALAGAKFLELEPEAQEHYIESLWDRWYGGKTFHQEPLYPYVLAVLRSLGGRTAVHVFQMLVGVLGVMLLYRMTKSYFGESAGLAAAALATLSAPLMFFELFELRASLLVFFGFALVWAYERTSRLASPGAFLVFGLVAGLGTTMRSQFALFALIGMALLLWPKRRAPRDAGRDLSWFAGGALLTFAPVMIRNLAVGAPLLSTTSVGPVTFANSNCAAYTGRGWLVEDASLAKIMGASDGAALATMRETLATHDSIGSYLGLLFQKLDVLCHWVEVANNVDTYFTQRLSLVLRLLPAAFPLIAALAIVGAVACVKTRRAGTPFLLLAALALVQSLAFYTVARFRLSLLGALLPFAGFGLVWLIGRIRAREFGAATLLSVGLAAGFATWSLWPQPEDEALLTPAAYQNAQRSFYEPVWLAAAKAQDWQRALAIAEELVEIRPPRLEAIQSPADVATNFDAAFVELYVTPYARLGESLRRVGRPQDAAEIDRRGHQLLRIGESLRGRRP